MPLPLAIPFALLLGFCLSWVAREELLKADATLALTRPFHIVVGFALAVFAPILAATTALHGDWAYIYLVDAQRIPSVFDAALILFAALQVPVGFALGAGATTPPQRVRARNAALATACVLVGGALISARRLSISATYAQLHGGFGGVPLGKSSLGPTLLWSLVVLCCGIGWSVYALRSSSHRRVR
jgi:hypothetical protein